MEMKNIARSALPHWMEKQKTLSPATSETDLFADAARMLGLLSGLLAEMAENVDVFKFVLLHLHSVLNESVTKH